MGLLQPAWQSRDRKKLDRARKEIERMNKVNDQAGLRTVMIEAPMSFVRMAAARWCRDRDALIRTVLKEDETFYVRSKALESLPLCCDSSQIPALEPLLKSKDYILPALAAICMMDKEWLSKNGTRDMAELIKSAKSDGNMYSHWADGFIEIIESIGENKAGNEVKTVLPEELPACDLIDYMTKHRDSEDFVRFGFILSKKLEENFRSRPDDVRKAIRTFGDSGMAARFDMIYSTMQPGDIGLLMPDLLKNYMSRYR